MSVPASTLRTVSLALVLGFPGPLPSSAARIVVGPERAVFHPPAAVPGRVFGPAVSVLGDVALVVWNASEGNSGRIVYARLGPEGWLDDPLSPRVITSKANAAADPAVSAGNGEWLVAWSETREQGDIRGAVVRPDGTLEDPDGFPITFTPGWEISPAVGWNGEAWLAAWETGSGVRGTRISPSGNVLDGNVTDGGKLIGSPTNTGRPSEPSVAPGPEGWLVTWTWFQNGIWNIRGTLYTGGGSVANRDGSDICRWTGQQDRSTAVPVDDGWLVSWRDRRDPERPTVFSSRLDSRGLLLEDDGGTPSLPGGRPSVAVSSRGLELAADDAGLEVPIDLEGRVSGIGIPVPAISGTKISCGGDLCVVVGVSGLLGDTDLVVLRMVPSSGAVSDVSPVGEREPDQAWAAVAENADGAPFALVVESGFDSRFRLIGGPLTCGGVEEAEAIPSLAAAGGYPLVAPFPNGFIAHLVNPTGGASSLRIDAAGRAIGPAFSLPFTAGARTPPPASKSGLLCVAPAGGGRMIVVRPTDAGVETRSVPMPAGSRARRIAAAEAGPDEWLAVWCDESAAPSGIYGVLVDATGAVTSPFAAPIHYGDSEAAELAASGNRADTVLVAWVRGNPDRPEVVGIRLHGTTKLDPAPFVIAAGEGTRTGLSVVPFGRDGFLVAWDEGGGSGPPYPRGVHVGASGPWVGSAGVALGPGRPPTEPAWALAPGNAGSAWLSWAAPRSGNGRRATTRRISEELRGPAPIPMDCPADLVR